MNLSQIHLGIYFVAPASSGGAYVVTRIAASKYAVFEISAADLITLRTNSDESIPKLDSAQIVVVGRTRSECLAAFEDL